MKITGGVLSSNAEDSHLIGEYKDKERLNKERKEYLNSLKQKVTNGEISLSQGSKLTNDINTSFNYYDEEFRKAK